MAEETVVVKIRVDADTREIERVQRQLRRLQAQAGATGAGFGDLNDEMEESDSVLGRLRRRLDQNERSVGQLDRTVNRARRTHSGFGGSISGVNRMLGGMSNQLQKVLRFGLKAFVVQLGLASLALAAIHASFAVGRVAIQAWQATLTAASGVGAAFVGTLATLAAGQREYNAALQATRYRTRSAFGMTGTDEAMAQLRGITRNTELAVVGAEALNAAFAGISRHTQVTGGLNAALTALGDFAVMSGDPAKGLAAAGEFLGLLADKGRLTKGAVEAAANIGPEFERALKQARRMGATGAEDFLGALTSGRLSGEVAGALDAINNTLFGTAKRYFQIIREDFADLGQEFLPEATGALERVARITRRTLFEVSGSIVQFSSGPLMDGLVSGFDRVADWTARTFNEYLPKAEGFFDRVRSGFRSVGDVWDRIVASVQPLRAGARVLVEELGPLVRQLFGGFGNSMRGLSDDLVSFRPQIHSFITALTRMFGEVGSIFGSMRESLFRLLPTLTRITDLFTGLLNAVGGVMGAFAGSSIGGLANIGMLVAGYKGLGAMSRRGGFMGSMARGAQRVLPFAGGSRAGVGPTSTQMMTVTAANVVVNGRLGTAGSAGSLLGVPGTGPTIRPNPAQQAALLAFMGAPGAPVPPTSRLSAMAARVRGSFAPTGMGSMIAAMGLPLVGSALGDSTGNPGLTHAGTIAGLGLGARMMFPKLAASAAFAPGLAATAGGALIGGSSSALALHGLGNNHSGATTSGVGIGTGALTGAAAGAGIGALFGPASPVAIPVMALLGGIGGAVSGWIQSGKMKGQASEAAQELVGTYDQAIMGFLQAGQTGRARKLMKRLGTRGETLAETSSHRDSFLGTLRDGMEDLDKKTDPYFRNFRYNLDHVQDVTGRTNEQLRKMAAALGVNLTTARGATEMLDKLGIGIINTVEQLRSAETEALGGVFDWLGQAQKIREGQHAVDQATIGVRDKARSGTLERADVNNLFQSALQYELSRGADPIEAMQRARRMLGDGGLMFNKGNMLEGVDQKLFRQTANQLMPQFGRRIAKRYGGSIASRDAKLNGMFGLEGPEVRKSIREFFSSGDASGKDLQTVRRAARSDKFWKSGHNLSELMRVLGIQNPDIVGAPGSGQTPRNRVTSAQSQPASFWDRARGLQSQSQISGMMREIRDPVGRGTEEGIRRAADAIRTAVAYGVRIGMPTTQSWGSPSSWGGVSAGNGPQSANGTKTGQVRFGGDTASARFRRTFGAHRRLSGGIPGRQSVISGLRNYNLGSGNSDHVTGAAYDLMGDNLGAYQSAVRGNGGFAELHGRGGSRHLHVVPGDTASPAAVGAPTTAMADVTINVYPAPGQDPSQIADEVFRKFKREQQSMAERR